MRVWHNGRAVDARVLMAYGILLYGASATVHAAGIAWSSPLQISLAPGDTTTLYTDQVRPESGNSLDILPANPPGADYLWASLSPDSLVTHLDNCDGNYVPIYLRNTNPDPNFFTPRLSLSPYKVLLPEHTPYGPGQAWYTGYWPRVPKDAFGGDRSITADNSLRVTASDPIPEGGTIDAVAKVSVNIQTAVYPTVGAAETPPAKGTIPSQTTLLFDEQSGRSPLIVTQLATGRAALGDASHAAPGTSSEHRYDYAGNQSLGFMGAGETFTVPNALMPKDPNSFSIEFTYRNTDPASSYGHRLMMQKPGEFALYQENPWSFFLELVGPGGGGNLYASYNYSALGGLGVLTAWHDLGFFYDGHVLTATMDDNVISKWDWGSALGECTIIGPVSRTITDSDLTVYGSFPYLLDELRFGGEPLYYDQMRYNRSLADSLPIPEPGAMAVVAISTLALARRPRRRVLH